MVETSLGASTPAPSTVLLAVSGLNVSYDKVVALREVAFELRQGEIIGVLGANGAGKSTLLKAISGLVTPTAGSITLEGTDLLALPGHVIPERGVAHVPERRRVFPNMTVHENLLMGGYVRRAKKDNGVMEEVLTLFPRLRERSKQLAGSLSGGEQQMLAVGRALMSQPRLLMLDEPSLGLAPLIVEQMFERIEEIHRDLNISIILVEQNAAQALDVVQRGIVLENGRVTFSGTSEELRETPYLRQAYLGV